MVDFDKKIYDFTATVLFPMWRWMIGHSVTAKNIVLVSQWFNFFYKNTIWLQIRVEEF